MPRARWSTKSVPAESVPAPAPTEPQTETIHVPKELDETDVSLPENSAQCTDLDKWLTWTPEQLIILSQKHTHWKLASCTLTASLPTICKHGSDGYFSEPGNIRVCLYLQLPDSEAVSAKKPKWNIDDLKVSVVEFDASRTPKLQKLVTVQGETGRLLVSAFACTFPKAILSVDGGVPVMLHIVDAQIHKYVSLETFIWADQQKYTKFAFAIPQRKPAAAAGKSLEQIEQQVEQDMTRPESEAGSESGSQLGSETPTDTNNQGTQLSTTRPDIPSGPTNSQGFSVLRT